ncbi:MAG: CYTH domain-containing protein [bacterium]
MATEIERKFLVTNSSWREGAVGKLYRQGYLSTEPDRTVRVRTIGRQGFLTIKGKTIGPARQEYEYGIPFEDASRMLAELCSQPTIEKTRYIVEDQGQRWEVDEFHGENAGLILAEIELQHEAQEVKLPAWVGQEVTGDRRYANAHLAHSPYKTWRQGMGEGLSEKSMREHTILQESAKK